MKHTKVPIKSIGNPMGFVQILPNSFDNIKKYPVMFWLHGIGSENGGGTSAELDEVMNITVSQFLKSNEREFVVIVPQDYNGYWGTRFTTFVQWFISHYKLGIDLGAFHLAGLSGGGYGIRNFIKENSDFYKGFATFTPMSTSLQEINSMAQRIIDNDQYLWIHHGLKDTSPNALGGVQAFHENVIALDPNRSRLTVYTELGHSAWNEVYDDSGMLKRQQVGPPYYEWTSGSWWQWLQDHSTTIVPVPPVEVPLTDMRLIGDEIIAKFGERSFKIPGVEIPEK